MKKLFTKNNILYALSIVLLFLIAYILQLKLVIPSLLLCLSLYVRFRALHIKNYNLLNLSLLFVIIFVLSYFIIKQGLSEYTIPFIIIPMLATILFGNLEISLLLTLAASISVASIAGNYLYLSVLFLVSGLLSSILVFDVRRRMAIIQAGFLVGLVQALLLFFIGPLWTGETQRYWLFIVNGIVSSIIVLGILPVFEYLFKTVTNISLLELADFNHPLLQRMVLEAPGTYHHSLIVGNLSDAACTAVGANSLLARIGAYYHDIGKLVKPEYFSENQTLDENKHDLLAPSMSKLVIMNHVKEGVELANKHHFNSRLIDFILQHHGDSLVFYFYRRALENLEEDHEVKEEGFRYAGPKPDSKETAIVLLADSVEAASRALQDSSPKKVEEVVHKIINNKFIDGQLDQCDLTLKDLEKISAVFIHILSGIYHSRINYPESIGSENNHKKSAEDNSRQSRKDKKSSS